MEEVKSYFEKLRFDKNHHLGLGDIRLTIAQQDEIVALIEQKLNKHDVSGSLPPCEKCCMPRHPVLGAKCASDECPDKRQ